MLILKNDWIFAESFCKLFKQNQCFPLSFCFYIYLKTTRSTNTEFSKKMLDESHLQKFNLFQIKTCIVKKESIYLFLKNLSKPTITNWNKTYEMIYLFLRSSPREIKRQLKFNPFKRKPIKFVVNVIPTWFTAHDPREQTTPIGAKPTVLPTKSIPLFWIKKLAIIYSKFINIWLET